MAVFLNVRFCKVVDFESSESLSCLFQLLRLSISRDNFEHKSHIQVSMVSAHTVRISANRNTRKYSLIATTACLSYPHPLTGADSSVHSSNTSLHAKQHHTPTAKETSSEGSSITTAPTSTVPTVAPATAPTPETETPTSPNVSGREACASPVSLGGGAVSPGPAAAAAAAGTSPSRSPLSISGWTGREIDRGLCGTSCCCRWSCCCGRGEL